MSPRLARIPRHERRSGDEYERAAAEGRRKYFDPALGKTVIRILPGECYLTGNPEEMLVTVLGSCVAACARDPLIGVGGMNHFMLPDDGGTHEPTAAGRLRYGRYAMEALINGLLEAGGQKSRLEIKVFGGADFAYSSTPIGSLNGAFMRRYLRDRDMPCLAADLGGDVPRRVCYAPDTGKVDRLRLVRATDQALFREEAGRQRLPRQKPGKGGTAATDISPVNSR